MEKTIESAIQKENAVPEQQTPSPFTATKPASLSSKSTTPNSLKVPDEFKESPVQKEIAVPEQQTPSPAMNPANLSSKSTTPDSLKVPEELKFTERYKIPAMEKSKNSPIQKEIAVPEQQTPSPAILSSKSTTPSSIKVPEEFKESSVQKENAVPEQQTPSPGMKPASLSSKSTTPDRLKVPKAFKYPERYTSPTDQMVSPVSKRLLSNARSRKPSGAAVPLPLAGSIPKPMKIQAQTQASPSSLQPALLKS